MHYMVEARLTKTPAYARLSGLIPIPYDEGMGLMAREHIFPDEMPLAPSTDGHSLLLNALRNKRDDWPCLFSVQDLPAFLLSDSRIVVECREYCSACLSADKAYFEFPIFDKEWLNRRDNAVNLDGYRNLLAEIKQSNIRLVLTSGMFDVFFKQVAYLASIGCISNLILDQFFEGITTVYEGIRKIIFENSKNLTVYDNVMFSMGNQFLLPAAAQHAAFVWSDSISFHQVHFTDRSRNRYIKTMAMLNRCQNLTSGSERDRMAFIELLATKIRQGNDRIISVAVQ